MKKVLWVVCLLLFGTLVVKAEELAPNAKSAVLMNFETGKIVFEKNSKEKLAPASMTKIMTLLLIMEQIDDGKLSLNDQVVISSKAASMGGSQIFLEANSSMKVEELIKGISIASGNDAAVAMAEKIGGSTENFVKMMNDKCSELGCQNTNFVNVHGLDEENHYSCANDMALMARELIKHKDILKYTSTYEEYLNKPNGQKIWLVNTNKLVRFMPGVDGLKTGFTANAGYCLTATAMRNDIRFISVVMGEANTNLRSEDTTSMLNYGFNTYKLNKVIDYNTEVGKVKVDKGKKEEANLIVKEEIMELKNINEEVKSYEYKINVDRMKAPVKKGDKVGTLDILDGDNVAYSVDLTIKEDIDKSSFFDILKGNLKIVLCGWK